MIQILLVEPDARERGRLSRALALEGYAVRTAQESREAVRLFLAHPADLLLVSQREPTLDGRIAFELLTAIKPSLPVIMVTPPAPPRVLDKRLRIRVVIEKPGSLPVLMGVLRQFLQSRVPPRASETRGAHEARTASRIGRTLTRHRKQPGAGSSVDQPR